jgi:hypothetical protein
VAVVIPTTADDETLERYVLNIVQAFTAATADQVARGRAWYPVAHDLAELVGRGDARKGAGIIAALSPNKAWDINIKLAKDAGNGNVHGHFTRALGVVRQILEGCDPESVLPAEAKTGHFFRNIADPADPDPVTVDRHAYRVATRDNSMSDDFGLSNKKRYATLALAYRLAARRLGEVPCVVQAVTWLAQREQAAE